MQRMFFIPRALRCISKYGMSAAQSHAAPLPVTGALQCSFDVRTMASKALKSGSGSTPKSPVKDVELPIRLYGVHARYANALYIAAAKNNEIERVAMDLAQFVQCLENKANDQLKELILDPTCPKHEKLKDIEAVSKDLKLGDLASGFLGVLVENGRLAEYEKIIQKFVDLMAARAKYMCAKVTTAKELDDKDSQRLLKLLGQRYAQQDVELLEIKKRVDPSILGGFVIEVGDELIDLSVSSKLEKLKRALSEPNA